jgi:hypothetical protein
MKFSTPAGRKEAPDRSDIEALRNTYIFCAERLKEIGSFEVSEPRGNRYIGGFAHGNVQCQDDAIEFEYLQEAMRSTSKLLHRYDQASAAGYDGMLYRRYNFQGELVLVPDHWPAAMTAANIAKIRIFGADESKWGDAA